jgi:hypothetical protein
MDRENANKLSSVVEEGVGREAGTLFCYCAKIKNVNVISPRGVARRETAGGLRK